MNIKIEEFAEKALALSPSARAHLAEILLESLDYEEDFVISPEWMAEIRRRCREGEPWTGSRLEQARG